MAEIRPVGRLEENIALAIVQADEDVGVARNDILHDLQPSRWRVVSVVEDRLQGGAELPEIVNVALFKVGLHRMDHDPGEGEEGNDGGEANKEGQPGGQEKGRLAAIRHLKHIADAAHGLDELRLEVVINFGAQPLHRHVDGVSVAVEVHIPHLRGN